MTSPTWSTSLYAPPRADRFEDDDFFNSATDVGDFLKVAAHIDPAPSFASPPGWADERSGEFPSGDMTERRQWAS